MTATFTAKAVAGATYSWDFDDGAGSGRIASHTYSSAGHYNVVLTVTRGSASDFDTMTIDVPCP